MKRRSFISILMVVFLVALVLFAFTACGDDPKDDPAHTHTYITTSANSHSATQSHSKKSQDSARCSISRAFHIAGLTFQRVSIASIKKHGIVLKEVLNEAVLEELIPRNPASGVKLPAKVSSQRGRVFLNAQEANQVLTAFAGHQLQPLVYTTMYYGLRRSEVLGLRWNAVDFEKDTITINHTVVKNRTIVEKDSTKTQSRFHTYKLIDDVKKVLLEHRARQDENRKTFGCGYKESDYIFVWDDGTKFRPDYVTRGFQRVLKSHNLPVMRFHDLRHSTASILYDKGWDLKDIQLWLRHSSIDVTADIYTHISENRKSSMASSLNSTFKL